MLHGDLLDYSSIIWQNDYYNTIYIIDNSKSIDPYDSSKTHISNGSNNSRTSVARIFSLILHYRY